MLKYIYNYNADLKEISLIKICAFAFALFFAKLFPDLLVLDWYW